MHIQIYVMLVHWAVHRLGHWVWEGLAGRSPDAPLLDGLPRRIHLRPAPCSCGRRAAGGAGREGVRAGAWLVRHGRGALLRRGSENLFLEGSQPAALWTWTHSDRRVWWGARLAAPSQIW